MDPDDIKCLNCGHAWGEHSPHGNCCADGMTCQCPGQLLDAGELRSLGKLTESMIRELSNKRHAV